MGRKKMLKDKMPDVEKELPDDEECTELGRPQKEETLENWYHVASLYVLRGMSKAAAYMQVYGAKSSSSANAYSLFRRPAFKAIVDRLRLSQCLTDEDVRKNIESLYLQTITNPEESTKNKLSAAAQWQKLRGLETQKVEIGTDADRIIEAQLRLAEQAMLDGAAERAARGRTLCHAQVEIEVKNASSRPCDDAAGLPE